MPSTARVSAYYCRVRGGHSRSVLVLTVWTIRNEDEGGRDGGGGGKPEAPLVWRFNRKRERDELPDGAEAELYNQCIILRNQMSHIFERLFKLYPIGMNNTCSRTKRGSEGLRGTSIGVRVALCISNLGRDESNISIN